ncbi:MAG: hypothetical protein ACU85E_11590 [Gammaproteobacteria bacterium]
MNWNELRMILKLVVGNRSTGVVLVELILAMLLSACGASHPLVETPNLFAYVRPYPSETVAPVHKTSSAEVITEIIRVFDPVRYRDRDPRAAEAGQGGASVHS